MRPGHGCKPFVYEGGTGRGGGAELASGEKEVLDKELKLLSLALAASGRDLRKIKTSSPELFRGLEDLWQNVNRKAYMHFGGRVPHLAGREGDHLLENGVVGRW